MGAHVSTTMSHNFSPYYAAGKCRIDRKINRITTSNWQNQKYKKKQKISAKTEE